MNSRLSESRAGMNRCIQLYPDGTKKMLMEIPDPMLNPKATESYPWIKILGVRIDIISLPSLLGEILRAIELRQKSIVSYVNVHALNLSCQDPWFKNFINHSTLVFCDGFGVVLAARLLGLKIPYRYTPPDWFPLLAERCSSQNYSIFLLGGQHGVADKVVEKYSQRFPLSLCGAHHGYFDHRHGSPENEAVIRKINQSAPQILLVGFGMPAQERWIQENIDHLDVNVILPVGALFDYLAGTVARAPAWMTDHGFEWLGRLVIEPRRLWNRYLIGNPIFFLRVLLQRFGLKKFT